MYFWNFLLFSYLQGNYSGWWRLSGILFLCSLMILFWCIQLPVEPHFRKLGSPVHAFLWTYFGKSRQLLHHHFAQAVHHKESRTTSSQLLVAHILNYRFYCWLYFLSQMTGSTCCPGPTSSKVRVGVGRRSCMKRFATLETCYYYCY